MESAAEATVREYRRFLAERDVAAGRVPPSSAVRTTDARPPAVRPAATAAIGRGLATASPPAGGSGASASAAASVMTDAVGEGGWLI